MNIEIRHLKDSDKAFWYTLDKHLPREEFHKKVRDKQGYVLLLNNQPTGILRYNLFWDNTPFCTLLYIAKAHRNNGYGKIMMEFWENEMQSLGYDWVLVSTQADENAQFFYRAIGYTDCGSFFPFHQPMELFLKKQLS